MTKPSPPAFTAADLRHYAIRCSSDAYTLDQAARYDATADALERGDMIARRDKAKAMEAACYALADMLDGGNKP